jgi:hypothetical protein
MRFLVVCDHTQAIIAAHSVSQAREQFGCRRCVTFDEQTKEWKCHDVRVYSASDSDVHVVGASGLPDGQGSSNRRPRRHQRRAIRPNGHAVGQEALFAPDVPPLPDLLSDQEKRPPHRQYEPRSGPDAM